MLGALCISLVVTVVVVLLVRDPQWSAARDTLFQALASRMDGVVTRDGVTGSIDGIPCSLVLRYADEEPPASHRVSVRCPLPARLRVTLQLQRHEPGDHRERAAGRLTDVAVGDDAFDARFLVEGAPADVIRRALTPELRGFLMAQRAPLITTTPGRLTLEVDAALGDLEAHAEAARVTARLVAGLQTAAEAIDASVAMAYGGDPFRGMPDDAPVRAARAARVAEVTRIDRQRADRAAHDVRVGLVLAVVVVTPILLAAVC
ncbi:MAG: hypothetical protein H6708_04700 [Kofleriaceae bacterium]|nr:hypothetical protein [Kofleriaceae bacterium]